MKTSNKLLVGIVGFILLSMFGLVLMGRMSMTSIKSEQMKGNGNSSEEYRTVAPFKGLKVSSDFQATLSKGDNVVGLKADDNLFEYIETTVENEELTIRWKSGFHYDGKPIQAMISMPVMNHLSASSGAHVKTADDFEGNDVDIYASSGATLRLQGLAAESLDMNLSSSSNVSMGGTVSAVKAAKIKLSSGSELEITTLTVDQLNVNLSSSSSMNVAGAANGLVASGSSGSRFDGSEFSVQNATIDGSSSSFFELSASEKLNVDLSSGSVVQYKGAARLTQNLSSGSTVKKTD